MKQLNRPAGGGQFIDGWENKGGRARTSPIPCFGYYTYMGVGVRANTLHFHTLKWNIQWITER